MDIQFADHPSFQRAAAGMAGGALLFGTALSPVTPLAPLVGGLLGVSLGAAIGYGRAGWRLGGAALAIAPLVVLPASWPLLAGVAAVIGLALAVGGARGWRGLFGMLIGAASVMAGIWCAARIAHADKTALWPAMARSAAAALSIGLVSALALWPRHLRLVGDPIQAAIKRLPATLDGEIRELCVRAGTLWDRAKRRLTDDNTRTLMRDGVLKTLEVAAHSADAAPAGASDSELAQRAADLERRIANTSDADVQAQYAEARTAIADQQRYRARIRQGRERLVARMHSHLAALEKLELLGDEARAEQAEI
jgi:hypothetical protein